MLPTEHEKQYFDFCNPYSEKRTIFAGILHSDLHGSAGNGTWMAGPDPPTTRAGGQDDVSYNKLPQINFGKNLTSNISGLVYIYIYVC